jgi:threonine dehydratase
VVEPLAGVGVAGALFNEVFRSMVERVGGEEGWDLGVVFSGGNIDLDKLGELIA